MADTPIVLNNYSDDSQIKAFMQSELAVRVFHDIPLNVLNAGQFSLTTEYVSQITEQLAFTSAFYYNENFITKAVLPDSIYAEASIFNIGYSFATPASSNFLLELKIEDIMKNAVFNADNNLYEFILDKNTKFNLPEGFVYSLDYDILIQYKTPDTATTVSAHPAWNVQYINRDQKNMCATNKNLYIPYRVTDIWLCLFVQANEYERETHRVVNNTGATVPNADTVITCTNHIAGFDIKYIDSNGNETYLDRDHILTVHNKVKDLDPYVNYIMDDPYTIRFMWQLAGNGYFVPETNSSYEITIYTCHGKAANAPNYKNDTQPQIITATNRYTNNANVMKAVFVIGGCVGGTDIGTTETVRRETIEAYNTAKVISSDHDIEEWFKTFYFKGLLYPYFFKRRDDPWGRIWSGYVSLANNSDDVFKTNTLHASLTYDQLYNNSDNTASSNEIIIPPGWLWVYSDNSNRYTVKPYIENGTKIENAKSLANITDKFVFANPFGIRIQKDPFAIGYFNPWVNQYNSATHIDVNDDERVKSIYHASHIISHIERTYMNDYYDINTTITTNVSSLINGERLITSTKSTADIPNLDDSLWDYFKKPFDLYSSNIPFLELSDKEQAIPFNPERTYICCPTRDQSSDEESWIFNDGLFILDESTTDPVITYINVDKSKFSLNGYVETWKNAEKVYYDGNPDINLYIDDDNQDLDGYLTFTRIPSKNYYELRLPEDAPIGTIKKVVVSLATETELTKYGETELVKLGSSYQNVVINVYYNKEGIERHVIYTISNAANVYTPYEWDPEESGVDNYVFNFNNIGANGIILYADMKPSPNSGATKYFKLKFSDIDDNLPLFYIKSNQLNMANNNLRVVMSAIAGGSVTGTVEMQPVSVESDGSYIFNTSIHPLTELVDLDNRIFVASTTNGGGSWINAGSSETHLDVTEPKLKISILFKNETDMNSVSPISEREEFKGYICVDEYYLDDVDLVQELKEMRSIVDFGDYDPPTEEQQQLYDTMIELGKFIDGVDNIYYMTQYAYDRVHDIVPDSYTDSEFLEFKTAAGLNRDAIDECIENYEKYVSTTVPEWFNTFRDMLDYIATSTTSDYPFTWMTLYTTLSNYLNEVDRAFDVLNVHGDVIIQQVPFVARTLITSDDFANFVSSFTQVHKAIEPVIFERLEGNNYLDCKLIATYGKPHSYSADIDVMDENKFWPDLSVQIEFDVKLYDNGLDTTTIEDLKSIIKSYFNRITTVHTPTQNLSMENNIYISNLIQQMEAHKNVAWLRFKGWYTNEKNIPDGNYMNATVQAIVQKWKKLEDMPTDELERYVPEMFLLEPNNIVINIVKS